jgi:hypothetical protein
MTRILILAASLGTGVLQVGAQPNTASLQGSVLDPSGSLVPRATVTVARGQTIVGKAQTDAAGHFGIRGIPPGSYAVRASAVGFSGFELPSYTIEPGSRQTLDIRLTMRGENSQVTVSDAVAVDVDPANNAGAIILSKEDMDALPDDRDDLATDLQALAGPAAGPNGGEIYIDGFTGGRLPSKQSIREIRINANPFAAQFDRPGQGRIEIFTKPGSEDLHGEILFQFSDAALNSRNPFVAEKPPYQRRQWEGEVTGPLGKKTSFFFDFERRDINDNAFVNAITLDSNLNTVPVQQAIVTPLAGVEINVKIGRQLTKDHTLTVKYGYQGDGRDNQGVGGFSLLSRAYTALSGEQVLQAIETGILNFHTINETRFRFRRQTTDESGGTIAPSISVLDAFSNGGSPLGVSFDHQNRYEFQNSTSYVKGAHVMRFGGLIRGVTLANQAMQNYAGTFTFTSLDSYRLTLLGMRQGLSMDQIRAMGGGPNQFSISAGDPLAALHQFDYGFFAQDDWRVLPSFTLSGGLRWETQTHSRDRSDFGPRIGFAWGLGGTKAKTAKSVIRGGFGMFYDRLSESLTLDALRQDGIRQQGFLISTPAFYPNVPSIASLIGSAQPQTLRRTDAQWQAPLLTQAAIGFERQLAKGVTIASNYIHSTGTHALRSRNINAPLPESGLRPYGGVNAIYLYESSGVYRQNQWITNLSAQLGSKLTISGFYAWGSARSNTDGPGSFPDNQYDTSREFGRAGFDVRNRLQLNGSWSPKWGLRISPFVTIASGRPFNITTGRDLNSDGLYLDRPAYATDRNIPSVIATAYGLFDTMPGVGSVIIPRNLGDGPGVIAINFRLSKSFDIGGGDDAGGKKSSDPKQITLSMNARNAINHPNLAAPDGNLSSPVFGQSTSLAGGQGVTGTRRIDVQIKFNF